MPLLKCTFRTSQAGKGRWICVWIACALTFGSGITSPFAFDGFAARGSLLGGLGNALQVYVIYMPMMMYHEKEMADEDWSDIEMTDLERVVVF